MQSRKGRVIVCLLGLAGTALGQDVPIYRAGPSPSVYRPDLSTAPSLAVGEYDQIVVVGSHRMMMFDHSTPIDPLDPLFPTTPLDQRDWGIGYAGYPFVPTFVASSPNVTGLTYPRVDYDPITRNVWMMYAEADAQEGGVFPLEPGGQAEFGGGVCRQRLHLAASRQPDFANFNSEDSLGNPDPHGFVYYTGNVPPTGQGGTALDLGFPFIPKFRDVQDLHEPVQGNVTFPSFGFDTDHVFIAAMDPLTCAVEQPDPEDPVDPETGQFILIMPRHFTGGSGLTDIHAGGRIDESELTIVRLADLQTIDESGVPDPSFRAYTVQEPYEQYENATLFVSTDGKVFGGVGIEGIRLKGIFWNDDDDRWEIRQRLGLDGAGNWKIDDMPITGLEITPAYGHPAISLNYPEAPNDFRPAVEDESFHSAVLTMDNQGRPRVFAVHAGLVNFQGDIRWAVQWYVIDPHFTEVIGGVTTDVFHDAPILSDDWQPQIVAKGRITTDGALEPTIGDCYHPVIGVTRSGRAYIEYTYSNATTDQRILRAELSNTYTAVGSTTVLQAGPSTAYADTLYRWGLYGDMQADPTGCNLWSTHTLVEDASTREVWLFDNPFNCFTTDLNASESTDMSDMAIYGDLFWQGQRRADTDANGVVDATDMATFIDAYDAATGP